MKRGLNFGYIIKLLALAAIVVIGIFVYVSCTGGSCLCQRIDKTLPDVTAAPYTVTTHTHSYYAKEAVTNPDGSVTMTRWYEKIDGKWIFRAGPDTLPKILKPVVKRR